MNPTIKTSAAAGWEASPGVQPVRRGQLSRSGAGRALALAVAIAAPVVGWVSAADAAGGSFMASSGGHYGCTNTALPGCRNQGMVAAGTAVTMHCWIDDSWAVGAYGSNRWFYVTTANGIRNFVHSSRVERQSVVPHCNSHRGVAAARWAAMQFDETVPGPGENAGNSRMDRWSGWCYVFAWDAHALSHGARPLTGYGSAKNTFYAYDRLRRVKRDLNPAAMRIGSIVFWTSGSFGHAAIYVGQGMVVTTQGFGTEYPPPPVTRLPMGRFGTPAGWVSADNI